MKLIDLIAGARPNFMKIAPIIDAINIVQRQGSLLDYRLIHTGQHYDKSMSDDFFSQLGIPKPHMNFGVGSGSQAEQTANIMIRYEQALIDKKSSICLVVGDVTSTMACTIVARKFGIPVAHVEAGIRSGDWTMPEEINRIVTDSISSWFFTTSETANKNLRTSGVSQEQIFFVGNTMIDTLMKQLPRLRPPSFWDSLGLTEGEYYVTTLHRPANVDGEKNLYSILHAISDGAGDFPVIFPVHPRTAKNLQQSEGQIPGLHFVEPLGYLEFNYLVKNSKGVITDSGGITEETTVLGIPCLTLRNNTERPETITIGTNELIGTDPKNLAPALMRLNNKDWKKGNLPEKWDGQAAIRIVNILERLLK